MRLGRAADAVQLYRSFVLERSTSWMRAELPVIYRTNFVTALLLSQVPLGAQNTLHEIREIDHPSVVRLRETFDRWKRSLSLWQRLGWTIGLPPNVPIELDFTPGEFVDPPAAPARNSSATASSPNQRTQKLAP